MLGADEEHGVLELQEQLPSIQNISINDEDVNVKARASSPDGRFLKFEEEIGEFRPRSSSHASKLKKEAWKIMACAVIDVWRTCVSVAVLTRVAKTLSLDFRSR